MIKFEGGYSVEIVFDGRKFGIDPYTIAVSPTGELIILDSLNSNVHTVSSPLSKYSRPKLITGSLEGYTGHVDGKLREAKMHQPKGVAVDDRGNIYIADTMNMAVRKISSSGVVTTIAGGRMNREIDGSSEDVKFSDDFDVTYVRSSCFLLVVDRGSQVIRGIQLQYGDCYASEQPQSQDIEDNFNLVSEGLITPTMSISSHARSPAAATQSITGKSLIEQKVASARAAQPSKPSSPSGWSASKLHELELVDEIGVNARLAFQDAMSLKERTKDLVDDADKMAAQVGKLRIGLSSAETRAQEAEQRLKEVQKSIADMKADQERMRREHADELASETGRIKMKYARICLRLSSAETRAQEAEQRLKEVQKSVAEMKADQERMTQEHADELASEAKRIKTEYARIASDVGAYFSIEVRIEMMKEFQSDRHES